jgi:hypothetical protein
MSAPEKTERPKLQLQHGFVEIERKFLVMNDEWRRSAVRSVRLRDGLIAAVKEFNFSVAVNVPFAGALVHRLLS